MDFGRVDTRRWFIGTGLFVAVLFALTNPEGSAPGSLWIRVLQWLLNIFLALGILIVIQDRLNHWTNLTRSSPWLALTVSGLVGSVLFSPFALGLDILFGENVIQETPGAGFMAAWLDELAGATVTTTMVWLGMNAPAVLRLDFDGQHTRADRQERALDNGAGSAAGTPDDLLPTSAAKDETPGRDADHYSSFLDLLPDRIGRDIVWMKSELHYLRVVTTHGKALVLFNLRDAVDLMPEKDGLMPHRSFWIAYRHVERLISTDGRTELSMTDGTRIPVARRRRAEVRQRVGL